MLSTPMAKWGTSLMQELIKKILKTFSQSDKLLLFNSSNCRCTSKTSHKATKPMPTRTRERITTDTPTGGEPRDPMGKERIEKLATCSTSIINRASRSHWPHQISRTI
jgi:hypothetical protein